MPPCLGSWTYRRRFALFIYFLPIRQMNFNMVGSCRRRKVLLLASVSLCFMVLFIVHQMYFSITCLDINDDSYSPPDYLVEKWMLLSLKNQEQSVKKRLTYDKFSKRNEPRIVDRLEKFTELTQPINDILTQLASKYANKTLKSLKPLSALTTQKQYCQKDVNYFEDIAHKLVTHAIDINFTNLKLLLISEYFNTTATNCTDFEIRGVSIGQRLTRTPGCDENPSNALHPLPLQVDLINQGIVYPSDTTSIPVTYIHVLVDAFVDGYTGDIMTENSEIVVQRCAVHNHEKASRRKINSATQYDQVLTIAQYWGEGYFHHTLEQLPRLALYLQFLQQNPHIFVHVISLQTFVYESIKLLGITKKRIISGDIRARILYAPVGGKCGSLPLFQGQMLSLLMRQQIQVPPERRSIVLIRRSHKRYFYCNNNINDMLEKEATAHGLKLEIYGDAPSPSQQQTAEIFNRAVMVVAPHGAGLANMVFCESGTVIIEGVCFDWMQPKLNHCYEHTALVLGHRYVAVNYPSTSCHYFQAADIKPVVKYFLHSLLLRS